MRRLPIRWQVTLTFALVLAVVLGAVGAFLYLRFEADLHQTIDNGLRSRADEVSGAVRRPGAPLGGASRGRLIEEEESFAQVLSLDGRVIDGTRTARRRLLDAGELRRARSASIFTELGAAGPDAQPARLLAVPVRTGTTKVVIVVGASLEDSRDSLRTLRVLEIVGLLAALLLASAAGYWVSGLALRPVEAMRRRAEAISGEPGRRLPVPPVDDEVGRLGTTLNAMLDRLDEALAAQREALAKERRFVADASHELRTPLTVLRSEIEVALLRERTPQEMRAALVSTGEEAERLSRLAEDLLVLARADEGALPIRPESVEVGALLEKVAGRRRGEAEAAGRAIGVEAPANLTVEADPLRLEQAVSNLLDNAIGHGGGDVEVNAREDEGFVQIAVRDHGAGFPPDFLGRAFERFARPDSGRVGGGVGLGLAIAAAVAAAHGGSATAANAAPGARVTLMVPARLTVSSST